MAGILQKLWDSIFSSFFEYFKYWYDFAVKGHDRAEINKYKVDLNASITVHRLKYVYQNIPSEYHYNTEVVNCYTAKKEDLEAQGANTLSDMALGWVGKQLADTVHFIMKVSREKIMPSLKEILRAYNIEEERLEKLDTLAESGEFGLNAIVSFIIGVTLYPEFSGMLEPFMLSTRQTAYSKHRVTMLTPDELLRMKWRYPDSTKYNDDMPKYGYSKENLEDFEKVNKYYPSPTDFIRFAVREAFDDDVAARYGYDEAFPEQMVSYVEKAGMSRDWLKYYWRSHWEMVSPRMAYEMLHRGEITKEDLETILRIADFPPYLIPKMVNISYRPYTRVDVRRMYREGTLNRDQMKRAYLDLGYDDEKAENMTLWSIAYARGNERDLTRSLIIRAYKYDELEREEAITLLTEINYDKDEADLIVSIEEHKEAQDEKEDIIDTLKDKFKAGLITYQNYTDELNNLGLKASYTNKLLAKAERDKARSEKHLSFKMYSTLWFNDRITEQTMRDYMKGESFTDEDIELFVKNKDVLA